MQKFTRILFVVLIALFAIITSVQAVQAQAAWAPNTAYSVNALVTYGGHTYKCLQAHTSLVGWEPPNTPALWQDMGAGGSTSVPPTKTNTPVGPTPIPPTKTNTPVGATSVPPTKTNTPGSGGTCAAAYNNASVYTGGMQVSFNGHNWTAKWWTQGEAPSTGGSGVWADNGACGGGTVPTNTAAPNPTKTNTPTGPTSIPPTNPPPPPGGPILMGYFAEWGIYARNYQPKNIVTSGSASN